MKLHQWAELKKKSEEKVEEKICDISTDELEKVVTDCTLGKPLLMVIPAEGCNICCPVHGTHRIYGQKIHF